MVAARPLRFARAAAKKSVQWVLGAPRSRRTMRAAYDLTPESIKRQLGSRVQRIADASAPLLSVIVPVYNVEPYLAECLDSLINQSHRNLEIIVVEDGSTDASSRIVDEYARTDRRFTVIRQANAGLGAARNTGLDRATGRYVAFLDSDDSLPPNSYARMVKSLELTGSDFVVGALRRFTSGKNWAPAWHPRVHDRARLGLGLAEFPEAVRNNYTVNKVYRRDFCQRAGLRFREGVRYEDQPIITLLYLRASRFDVLKEATYDYRVRGDRSSISQQTHTLSDLTDRVLAWRLSADAIGREAPPEVFDAWLLTLFDAHLLWYLNRAPEASVEYWEMLSAAVRELTDLARPEVWRATQTPNRVCVWLARHGQRERLMGFLGSGGRELTDFPVCIEHGRALVRLPFHDDGTMGAPADLYQLNTEELALRTGARRLRWVGPSTVEIAGFAYIDHIDLSDRTPTIRLSLVNEETGDTVEARLRPCHDRVVLPSSRHKFSDFSASAFTAVIDTTALLDNPGGDGTTELAWRGVVTVEVEGIIRSGPLVGFPRTGSTGQLPVRILPDGRRIRPLGRDVEGLRFLVDRPAVYAEDLSIADSKITVTARVPGEFRPVRAQLTHNASGRRHDGPTVSDGDGRFIFTLPAPAPEIEAPSATYTLRVADRWMRSVPISWTPGLEVSTVSDGSGSGIELYRSPHGNVSLLSLTRAVVIRGAEVVDERLRLTGYCHGLPKNTIVELSSARLAVPAARTDVDDGRFVAELPLSHDEWGFGQLPLPAGTYRLGTRVDEPETAYQVHIKALIDPDLLSAFPLAWDHDRLRLTVNGTTSGELTVAVTEPLAADEYGAYRQRLLRAHYLERRRDPMERAVLFRSYYGENASCNGRAVHEELRRRSSPLTLYWTVRDHSVLVPDGGVPVVRNTRQWYEAFARSRYVIDNMHQPTWVRKRPGQVFVQTFHGYPFKRMGHPHWASLRMSKAKLDSYDFRTNEWDYLISPASYATPYLRRDFRYEGEIAEIGYPRNDILVRDEGGAVRAEARTRLGIRDGQLAILYAPTFRDDLSADDFRAEMVDFLDVDLLAERLGDDYVILVRGHPFNARMPSRIGHRSTVIDVTDYPLVADLCLASDAAIMDYSSIRFDYGLTGKPMIFLVPDLARYRDVARGWLFDYEPTAPGPRTDTTDEVVDCLAALDQVRADYRSEYATFRRSYLDLDDGHASERFVDTVFAPNWDA